MYSCDPNYKLHASAVELGAHEREAVAKDLQETKAEQRETKVALQETKVALQEAKVEQTETKTQREVANLKATRTTQGAHEGSSSLVGSDRIVSGSRDN